MAKFNTIPIPTLSPQSTQQLTDLRSRLFPYTQGAVDLLGRQALGEDTGNYEAYKQNAFKQLRQGPIAQLYQNLGSFGSGKNSGLNNALAAAMADLEGSLSERREQTQSNAIRDLLNLQNNLINTRETDYAIQPKSLSSMQQFWKTLAGNPGFPNQLGGLLNSLFSGLFR